MTACTPTPPGRALRHPPPNHPAPRKPPDRTPAPDPGLSPVPRSPHPADVCRRLPGLLLIAPLALAALAGCNEHPLVEFEQTVTGAMHETSTLPAQTRMDLLFVIDDSQSMCQEQTALAANFARLADFFFERLGSEADLRIAVTSTDLAESDGRLLSEVPIGAGVACPEAEPLELDCADIDDPILATGPEGNVGRDCGGLSGTEATACVRADLDRRFRCLAHRGAGGGSREKGLEAMRRALSCDGPNAARFGACCTPDGFDPACAGEGPRPAFLRPDALLVVVFVSDEDDCSTRGDNPKQSGLAICRDAGLTDRDGDGVPDAFADPALCAADPATCMRIECGGLGADDCHQARCVVEGTEYSSCAWEQEALTPVGDYVRFLSRLKLAPAEQLLVAAIVGDRLYTPSGDPVSFRPPDGDPACSEDALAGGPTDACCRDGVCRSEVLPACETDFGRADPGVRYLAFAESIGAMGLDCVDESTSLCEGDLVRPLEALSTCIQRSLVRFCLSKAVVDPAAVRVNLSCLDDVSCEALLPPEALPPSAYTVAEDARCEGGWSVLLDAPPPAGARLTIDYIVEL